MAPLKTFPKKAKKIPRAGSTKAPACERQIRQAIHELRTGPVLSAPIRKWLADSLDEKAKTRHKLIIEQRGAGQPKGDIERFDFIRMEAAEYAAALIRYRGRKDDPKKQYLVKTAIAEAIEWAREPPRSHKVGRSALIEEYSRWKNAEFPLRSCEYFEGTETNEQAAAYESAFEKLCEEVERSRDPVEIQQEQESHAVSVAKDTARRIGVRFAAHIGEDVSVSLVDGWLEKSAPGSLTPDMAEALGEQLAQGFIEELARRLFEGTQGLLADEIRRRTSPK